MMKSGRDHFVAPGQGHFMIHDHLDEILASLTEK